MGDISLTLAVAGANSRGVVWTLPLVSSSEPIGGRGMQGVAREQPE